MNMDELKIKKQPDCKTTVDRISSNDKQECEELVIPRCCGVPKRPWDLCNHTN